jgi:hypothetical protein
MMSIDKHGSQKRSYTYDTAKTEMIQRSNIELWEESASCTMGAR